MELGAVIGNVWATRKEDGLTGVKFLVVQPEKQDQSFVGAPFIAVDRLGAGVGDRVLVTKGSSATNLFKEHKMPIDALIIGIIDSIETIK